MKKVKLFILVFFVCIKIQAQVPGQIDNSFYSIFNTSGYVYSSCYAGSGQYYIGGYGIIFYNFLYDKGLLKINSNGSLDTTFMMQNYVDGQILTIEVQTDGKILIGGTFSQVGTTSRKGLARINIDGSLDLSFNPLSIDSDINSIKYLPNGKIYVGGVNVINQNGYVCGVLRLNSNGSIDTTFNTGIGFSFGSDDYYRANSIDLQSDGKVIMVGNFPKFNGINKVHIVRINTDGSCDTTFKPNSHFVEKNKVKVLPDDKMLIVGNGPNYNGNYLRDFGIVKLHSDGTLDSSFHSINHQLYVQNGNSGHVNIKKVTTLSDGKIMIAGVIDTIGNGNIIPCFMRLHENGIIDKSFQVRKFNEEVIDIFEQIDGNIIVTGSFSQYGTFQQNKIIKLFGGSITQIENNDEQRAKFIVYPNPNNGVFTVKKDDNYEVLIVKNMLGQVVYELQTRQNETTIDLTNFPKGMYIVEGGSFNGNLIRKRVNIY